MDSKALRVAVIACNRPNYLYAALDSLFRNNRIQETDVHVYIDGNGSGVKDICEHYEIGYTIQNRTIGDFHHVVYALRDSFDKADKVVLMEEDNLLKPDTIQFCIEHKPEYPFISLSGQSGGRENGYRSIGTLISKEFWTDIDRWISNGEYFGKQKPNQIYSLPVDCREYDAVLYTYVLYNRLKTMYGGWYVAHFGLEGQHQGVLDPEGLAIKESMFCGKPTQWLDNILKIFSNRDNMSDRYKNTFIPKEFNYNANFR